MSQSEVADTFPVRIYWDTVEPKLLVCELCPLSDQRRVLEAIAEASGVALHSQPAAAGSNAAPAATAQTASASKASPSKEAGAKATSSTTSIAEACGNSIDYLNYARRVRIYTFIKILVHFNFGF